MKFLCLMGLFPKEYEKTIADDSIAEIQYAANKLQWAIVNGLSQQENSHVHILNSVFIGSYPRGYRKLRIPSFSFGREYGISGDNVGFLNLPLVKLLSKYAALRKKAEAWIRDNGEEDLVVIAYAMTSPCVELLHDIAAKHPKVKCLLVVPDLPEYMDVSNTSAIYRFMKKVHIGHMKNQLDGIAGYVFLTEHMKEWFDAPVAYTVVEGVYDGTGESGEQETRAREKVILYAGGLCEEYGLLDLAEAFRQLDAPDWKLELVGDGDLMPRLREMAKEDPRIVLKGRLPNGQVVQRQKEVSVLVNPRRGDQDFTKYSFPSKTIEYMASGAAMVGYKLPGMPEEYSGHFYEVSPEADGLRKCLEQVISLPRESRDEMGREAKAFILREKNAKVQCRKIVDLASRVNQAQRANTDPDRGSGAGKEVR